MNKNITIRLYLLTLLVIFLTSSVSMMLLFYYMDPESNLKIAYITNWVATFLSISSLLSLLIYFFKKIYYRWEMYLYHLNSSLRQAIFLTSYIMWIIIFNNIWVLNIKTASLLLVPIIFIEILFQSISD